MKYMIILMGDESQFDSMTEDEMGAMMQTHSDFSTWCADNGVNIIAGEELQPVATTKTFHADRTVTDGPYLEVKEQLGGFYIIEVDSPELAEQAAARCPNYGGVELRPVMDYGEE